MKNSNEGWKRIKTAFSHIKLNKFFKGIRITYGVVWNLLLLFIIVSVIGVAFAGGVGAGYFASLVKDEKVRPAESMIKDIYQYEETSKIYFADNILLGKLRTDLDREEVKIDQISDYLRKAIVATEDEYFYEHDGVVPKALLRAVYQEFTNSALQTGGSTLTQQLIKNQILTNEVSFDRKAKEVLLALRVERILNKDEILEAYLNVSTFGRNSSGQNIGGVQAAAKGVFGVEAKDLNLPQSAYIAGLPQSPFGYTPFTNKGEVKSPKMLEPGLNRMKTVLSRMHREGYITDQQYEDALKYDITADFIEKQPRAFEEYPALTFEIEERAIKVMAEVLAEADGISKDELSADNKLYEKYWTLANRDIRQNGYQIHTTINKAIYDAFEETKNAFENYGPTHKREVKNPDTGEIEFIDDPVQIGAYLRENKTGKILAFVAGRDFELTEVNHATKAWRQNGSTMKPLLVYAPAMEAGIAAPGSIIADVPYVIGSGKNAWEPKNFMSKTFYGLVTTREALAKSHNASAAIEYMKIIDQKPAKYLEMMGFSRLLPEEYSHPSLSLGALKIGVTVEENTNAYSTFANKGQFIDGYMIDKILDHSGNIVYEHKAEPVEVFSPQTAFLMVDVMRDVFKPGGTGRNLPSMLKFNADWAGKTGTTNDTKDSWLVATNPNVTFGTWIGYESNRTLYLSGNSEATRNQRIWANLMNAAYDVAPDLIAPKEKFEIPGGIVSRSYCAISGMLPSEACAKAGLVQTDYFNEKFVPTKPDDSLGTGRYFVANGKNYMALPSTPEEFTQPGMLLDPDFVERITLGMAEDTSQLIPKGWSNIFVADAKLEDDGAAPSPVTATLSDNTINWTASPSEDVIGYRIYSDQMKKIASIPDGSNLSFHVGSGTYYVVAVDVIGQESAPSNKVGKDDQAEKKEQEEDEQKKIEEEIKKAEKQLKEKEKEKEKDKKKDKKENPGNGNNNN